MVLYNEHNPDEEAIGSITRADLRARPDAVVVVGTTLKVPGVRRIAREMCGVVRDRRDGLTVWINNDNPPPGKDLEWDLIVKGPCDEVARHAAMRKWDDVFEEVTDEDMRKARETTEAKGIIVSPAKPKTFEQVLGVPTPIASPKFEGKTMKKAVNTLERKQSTTSLASITNFGEKKATAKSKATNGPKAVAPKRKRAPAKKTEEKNARINQAFKVSKPFVPPSTIKVVPKMEGEPYPQPKPQQKRLQVQQPKLSGTLPPPPEQIQYQWRQEYPSENADRNFIMKALNTPFRPSATYSAPMTDVSPSDVRNNSFSWFDPPRPAFSPLTDERSKSFSLQRAPTSPTPATTRRSSAPSGTISPTGYVPASLKALID